MRFLQKYGGRRSAEHCSAGNLNDSRRARLCAPTKWLVLQISIHQVANGDRPVGPKFPSFMMENDSEPAFPHLWAWRLSYRCSHLFQIAVFISRLSKIPLNRKQGSTCYYYANQHTIKPQPQSLGDMDFM
jgi:hypothetical protein